MSATSDAEHGVLLRAMRRALEIAATPGVPLGPNPRVGCVLLSPDGTEVAEGFHRGAGTPHAEVAALTEAGDTARGGTAVVTLEPCNHTGRTGPCATALLEAGVSRVVFAQPDPNPVAAGGAETLRAAGVTVVSGLLEDDARTLNRAWTFALEHGRPFVTWKFATTLDGRSAAGDGTSRWVSSREARVDSHRLRAGCDVMLVGTNTVAVDDPWLTVRDEYDEPLAHQPLRVVMGERDLPAVRRVLDDAAPSLRLRTRDPRSALADLYARGRRHVFLEGGPTLAAAFLAAGLVDEAVCYLAPALLGAGANAVADLGIGAIADARRLEITDVTRVGSDLRITMTPIAGGRAASASERVETPPTAKGPWVEEARQRRHETPPTAEAPLVEEARRRRHETPPTAEAPLVEEARQRRHETPPTTEAPLVEEARQRRHETPPTTDPEKEH